MKFSTVLNDFNGNAIMGLTVDETGQQIIRQATLGGVAYDALANAPASLNLTMAEKILAYKLAPIVRSGDPDVSIEAIALIKKCIGAVQSPLVVGECLKVLDPTELS